MKKNEKTAYLSLYRLQNAKLQRLNIMAEEYPENAEKYRREAQKVRELREKIECEIEQVDGGLLTEILCQKFLCGRTLEEIALRINYSKRQTERLFLKAIENFIVT